MRSNILLFSLLLFNFFLFFFLKKITTFKNVFVFPLFQYHTIFYKSVTIFLQHTKFLKTISFIFFYLFLKKKSFYHCIINFVVLLSSSFLSKIIKIIVHIYFTEKWRLLSTSSLLKNNGAQHPHLLHLTHTYHPDPRPYFPTN